MSERKNEKLAKAMSEHEGPFRVILETSQGKAGLWESEVYQFFDDCGKGYFVVYDENNVRIFSQEIL